MNKSSRVVSVCIFSIFGAIGLTIVQWLFHLTPLSVRIVVGLLSAGFVALIFLLVFNEKAGKEKDGETAPRPEPTTATARPVFKRWQFWFCAIFIIAGIVGAFVGSNKQSDDMPTTVTTNETAAIESIAEPELISLESARQSSMEPAAPSTEPATTTTHSTTARATTRPTTTTRTATMRPPTTTTKPATITIRAAALTAATRATTATSTTNPTTTTTRTATTTNTRAAATTRATTSTTRRSGATTASGMTNSPSNTTNGSAGSYGDVGNFTLYNNHEQQEVNGFALNTSTKKFHIPSCSEVAKIKVENFAQCDTQQEAIEGGYVPCKKCLRDVYDQYLGVYW